MPATRSVLACALGLGVLVVGLAGCARQEELPGGVPTIPYPLDRCLVSDDRLGADPNMETYVFVHEGQEIKLCCKGCLRDFEKNPQMYLAKLPPSVPAHAVNP